ncbi:hypothetical protein [Urbifossiella limnaea]|uniref:Uncharacterized protein n=1 Tax=Urbifossiella limnaea TaxID=2528023 RepID=A0A517XTP9_9BACT|nr:hypothetical protein [Urbifossiella limnaea]QDU20881.1 hypothetical protein ETAA1_28440 [Urbifossiella limnaea]
MLGLPWWVGLVVVPVVLFVGWKVFAWYVRLLFDQIVHDAVLGAGSALAGATAVVHSVVAVAAPKEPSPYDAVEGDEDYCEEIDGTPWEADEADFYVIDATITPADPTVLWDPTGLGVTPADFSPDDPAECSEHTGAMHSAERFVNGNWKSAREGNLTGPQRLRMLFGVPKGVRAVKFAVVVTYFGRVELPPPLPATPAPVGPRRGTGKKSSLPWNG